MFNRVILVGNLTRDPELRYLPSGQAICNSGIATNRRFKKQDGTQGEEVCFIDITLFGRTAEIANQYLKKGSKILVEGRLKFDSWTDQSGQKRSRHTVQAESLQMLDSKGQSTSSNEENYGGYDSNNSQSDSSNSYQNNSQSTQNNSNSFNKQNNVPEIDVDEDEIPF